MAKEAPNNALCIARTNTTPLTALSYLPKSALYHVAARCPQERMGRCHLLRGYGCRRKPSQRLAKILCHGARGHLVSLCQIHWVVVTQPNLR